MSGSAPLAISSSEEMVSALAAPPSGPRPEGEHDRAAYCEFTAGNHDVDLLVACQPTDTALTCPPPEDGTRASGLDKSSHSRPRVGPACLARRCVVRATARNRYPVRAQEAIGGHIPALHGRLMAAPSRPSAVRRPSSAMSVICADRASASRWSMTGRGFRRAAAPAAPGAAQCRPAPASRSSG